MLSRIAQGLIILALMLPSTVAGAAGERPDLEKVAKSLRGVPVEHRTRFVESNDHYLLFIGASPGTSFDPGTAAKSGDPEQIARGFLGEHAKAFGSNSPASGFIRDRVVTGGDQTYVRLQQTYDGIPVFGAQTNVQIGPDGGIRSVLSDIMRNTGLLDKGKVSTAPSVTAAAAGQAAVAFAQTLYPGTTLAVEGEPSLQLYHPQVIGNLGPTRLVWIVTVGNSTPPAVRESVFIDAQTREVAFHYSLIEEALFRRIYEYAPIDGQVYLRRQEGQNATGTTDVDRAYDYLGDTYSFYLTEHGRDSIDNFGLRLDAYVGYSFQNAYWDGASMSFGVGFVVDDVTAHELTHGVTQWSSDLIYANESGAMNESFSDIWGEFVDLTNGKGVDTPAVRWLMGEEVPPMGTTFPFGAIRYMKDPRYFGDPDQYAHYTDYGFFDNGGVHFNSGIGNKLAYLLTDGDTFLNSYGFMYTVPGIGISKAADLFYELQTNLLTTGSGFYDEGLQLVQAAYNLNYTRHEIEAAKMAAQAVQIYPPEMWHPLWHFRALSLEGESRVHLSWENPNPSSGTPSITMVRRTDRFANDPEDVQEGSVWTQAFNTGEEVYIDETASPNTEYFYAGFLAGAVAADGVYTDGIFTRVTTGSGYPDFYTQAFGKGAGVPLDLGFTQFTFEPTVDFTEAYASGRPRAFANYGTYAVQKTTGINALPVDSVGATYLTLTDDWLLPLTSSAPIPWFGRFTTNWVLSSNGYVADLGDMNEVYSNSYSLDFNYPSIPSHFDFPKIAFLFSDLSPHSGGKVWVKDLPDREVITFERVPEFGSTKTNTAQLELFFNGKIRVTLLDVNAENAIVGLSDGHGTPFDLATDLVKQTDLSALPTALPASLTQDTVPHQAANELEPISFSIHANAPEGGANPTFTFVRVDSNGLPMALPQGVTLSPASGTATRTATFNWTPTLQQGGYYTFRSTFALGNEKVSQDIQVWVFNEFVVPVLEGDPTITPASPQDHEILHLDYVYSHVEAAPEGPTVIHWFKNGVLIAGLTNRHEVLANMTTVGDKWRAIVTPVTVAGVQGARYQSEEVTIGPDVQPDVNKDGLVNSMDVQMVINAALGQPTRALDSDVDGDYLVNSMDVQTVINQVMMRR